MSTVLLIAKIGIVFGLLLLTLRYLRTWDRGKATAAKKGSGKLVEVVGQARLTKGASVAAVRIGGQTYAVGVTDTQVRLLSETPVELPVAEEDDVVVPEVALAADARPSFVEALRAQVALVRGGRVTRDVARLTDGTVAIPPARMPER
jgi:flagellar biogenesis protein FliO